MKSCKELFRSEGTKIAAKSFAAGLVGSASFAAGVAFMPVSLAVGLAVAAGGAYFAIHSTTVRKNTEKRTGQSLWKQDWGGFLSGVALACVLMPSGFKVVTPSHPATTSNQKSSVSLIVPAQKARIQGVKLVLPSAKLG